MNARGTIRISGFLLALFILISAVSADGTKCASCIYTNPTTIEMEVWPVEKYTLEVVTFRVYEQKAPSRVPYPNFNINLARVNEGGDVLESIFLKTDANGEAVFVPKYPGKYRVRLEEKDVYFTVNSRRGADENPTPANQTAPSGNQTNQTQSTNGTAATNGTAPTRPPANNTGQPVTEEKNLTMYLFWQTGCPHCAAEKEFLGKIKGKYPGLEIRMYEVSNPENSKLFSKMCDQYDSNCVNVPVTFIGDKVFTGFQDERGDLVYHEGKRAYIGYSNQMEKAIQKGLGITNMTTDVDEKPKTYSVWGSILFILGLVALFYVILYALFRRRLGKKHWIAVFVAMMVVALFVIIKTLPEEAITQELKALPFPLFTILLGFLDGFNPCAVFVLCFLLALLAYTKSKKKMALVGLTFIFTSSFMYAIYMLIIMGILTSNIFAGNQTILRVAVGTIAIVAGLLNIKEFLFFKKGPSLMIPEKYKPGIFHRMRTIVKEIGEAKNTKTLVMVILGTIALAAVVNIIELACSAILPLTYTQVMIENLGRSVTLTHLLYIALYCLVYIMPLLLIFFNFLYSFETKKLTERQGKMLKLISGAIMLILGLSIMFFPGLLSFG